MKNYSNNSKPNRDEKVNCENSDYSFSQLTMPQKTLRETLRYSAVKFLLLNNLISKSIFVKAIHYKQNSDYSLSQLTMPLITLRETLCYSAVKFLLLNNLISKSIFVKAIHYKQNSDYSLSQLTMPLITLRETLRYSAVKFLLLNNLISKSIFVKAIHYKQNSDYSLSQLTMPLITLRETLRYSAVKFSVFIALVVLSVSVSAQQVLTLSDALKIALENNYAIQVAKNDAAISANNNRLGAAGMLPTIAGTVNQDNQVIDTRQKFLNGTENNRDGAKSNNLNANIELGWTIFDGFKMFAAKNRLEELQKVGELKMRSNIEQTFMRVTKAYYDVLLAKQQLASNQDAFKNSEKRLELATEKYKAGKSAKTEMLKAQVDLNTDKAALMRQENNYKNSQTNLNQLLGRDLNVSFNVEEKLPEPKTYKLDDLLNKVNGQNTNLMIAKKNQQVSLLSIREIKAERMPSIQLKSGYNFNRQESEAGFLQAAQNNGFHYGAGLSINLFNGFDVNKRLQNARLSLKSNELVYKDSLTRLQNQVQQAFNNYVLSTQLIAFEKENEKVAQENFDIANEQYKVGVITSIELRDAQLNLLNSQIRLLNAQYEAQINETELLRLTGELVKL